VSALGSKPIGELDKSTGLSFQKKIVTLATSSFWFFFFLQFCIQHQWVLKSINEAPQDNECQIRGRAGPFRKLLVSTSERYILGTGALGGNRIIVNPGGIQTPLPEPPQAILGFPYLSPS
jgi:hypothetical protein